MLKKLSILMLVIAFTLSFASIVTAEEQVYQIYNSPDEYEAETGKIIDSYNEAPALADLVAKGELESVEERIPDNPIVIDPTEKIGSYGGTWDRVWFGRSDASGNIGTIVGEGMSMWSRDITSRPNVAQDWEITNDNKTIIFHLRKGIKWSDGVQLTADDAQFYYEKMISNKDLNPVFPSQFKGPNEGKAKFTKIDDYTFKLDFPASIAHYTLDYLSFRGGNTPLVAPKHYLKQFHPDFVSEEELQAKVEDAGVDTWSGLFDNKNVFYSPQRPVLNAWRAVTEKIDSTQFIFERNPYYWKVDTEGNQLPYIDRIRVTLVEDSEVVTMRALSGDIDYQYRHFKLGDYPVLKEREEQGGYKVMLADSVFAGVMLMPNQNIQDPVKKDIYQNKKFRYALSLAINREEINQMNYLGLGKPMQIAYAKVSPFYDEEWANAYVDYNPDRARELLDEIGFDKKDSEGFRLRPDGKRLRLSFDYCFDKLTADLELIKTYFEDVGIEARLNMMDRALYLERIGSAENDIAIWQPGANVRPDLLRATDAFLLGQFCKKWLLWFQTDGEKGEEPPAFVKKLKELGTQVSMIKEIEKKKEIMAEVTDILSEQLFMIGTVGELSEVGVANPNMKNIIFDGFMFSYELRYLRLAIPPTFFFEE